MTFGFVVTNTRFENLGSTSAPNPMHDTGTAFFTNFEFSVKAQLTPAFMVGSAFHYTGRNSVDGDGGAKYLQLDLGTIYSLSKSTNVYVLAVLQKANGHDSLGQPVVASISGFSPARPVIRLRSGWGCKSGSSAGGAGGRDARLYFRGLVARFSVRRL